jgi:hypothetical protein
MTMEIDRFKTAWQKQTVAPHLFPSAASMPRPLVFLRATAIREREKADEVARLVFAVFFSLIVAGAAFVFMGPGTGRVGAVLLVVAVLVDGLGGAVLLAGRSREKAGTPVLEFIRRERQNLERRLRFEQMSHRVMLVLFCLGVALFLWPQGGDAKSQALGTLGRTAILTAFLAFAWWRARARPKDQYRELDRYLADLSE